jgi:hypothetical protein
MNVRGGSFGHRIAICDIGCGVRLVWRREQNIRMGVAPRMLFSSVSREQGE